VITVTCALQDVSRQRPSKSPFLTSQQRTSSPAPTMALPAPVRRAVPARSSSRVQIAFDEPDATSPKVFECSNFLQKLVPRVQDSTMHKFAEQDCTYKYDFTIVGMPKSIARKIYELRDWLLSIGQNAPEKNYGRREHPPQTNPHRLPSFPLRHPVNPTHQLGSLFTGA
jgi:hypothetical protein